MPKDAQENPKTNLLHKQISLSIIALLFLLFIFFSLSEKRRSNLQEHSGYAYIKWMRIKNGHRKLYIGLRLKGVNNAPDFNIAGWSHPRIKGFILERNLQDAKIGDKVKIRWLEIGEEAYLIGIKNELIVNMTGPFSPPDDKDKSHHSLKKEVRSDSNQK